MQFTEKYSGQQNFTDLVTKRMASVFTNQFILSIGSSRDYFSIISGSLLFAIPFSGAETDKHRVGQMFGLHTSAYRQHCTFWERNTVGEIPLHVIAGVSMAKFSALS